MALSEKKPVPQHIAIIMDGNGRWAKKRGLPRTAGHAAGAESFRRIANYCRELGVKYLTVYAFSTENWKRSKDEVSGIMRLLGKYQPEDLTEALLSQYLYSKDVPDPELIIRPSGEQRTSNFLLWQSAYSEYVFMDVLWPDFGPDDLDKAIDEFHRRNRRFGGV